MFKKQLYSHEMFKICTRLEALLYNNNIMLLLLSILSKEQYYWSRYQNVLL